MPARSPPRSASVALVAGWLVPGAGHLLVGQMPQGGDLLRRAGRHVRHRAAARRSAVSVSGLLADPLVFLAAAAQWAMRPAASARGVRRQRQGAVTRSPTKYGNTFLIVAGLLNVLVAFDASDVARRQSRPQRSRGMTSHLGHDALFAACVSHGLRHAAARRAARTGPPRRAGSSPRSSAGGYAARLADVSRLRLTSPCRGSGTGGRRWCRWPRSSSSPASPTLPSLPGGLTGYTGHFIGYCILGVAFVRGFARGRWTRRDDEGRRRRRGWRPRPTVSPTNSTSRSCPDGLFDRRLAGRYARRGRGRGAGARGGGVASGRRPRSRGSIIARLWPTKTCSSSATAAVLVVTINRPKVLNALNAATARRAERGRSTRPATTRPSASIVLTGAGEKAFVAGADINELARADARRRARARAARPGAVRSDRAARQAGHRRRQRVRARRRVRAGDGVHAAHRRRHREVRPAGNQPRPHPRLRRIAAAAAAGRRGPRARAAADRRSDHRRRSVADRPRQQGRARRRR